MVSVTMVFCFFSLALSFVQEKAPQNMHRSTSLQQRLHTEWVPSMHWGGRQDFRNWNSGKEEGHHSDDIIYHLHNNAAISVYHEDTDMKKKGKCLGAVSLRTETVWNGNC